MKRLIEIGKDLLIVLLLCSLLLLAIAAILKAFQNNKYVNWAFYGLRPASTGLIGAACVAVVLGIFDAPDKKETDVSSEKKPAADE